jgi:thiol-disulfide isomerase/thioredoxin
MKTRMKTKFIGIILLLVFHSNCFSQKIESKKVINVLKISKNRLNLVYFLEPSCPVSQKYQSVIASIGKEFQTAAISTTFIFPASFSSQKEIVQFATEIDAKVAVVFDFKKKITSKIGAKITPEVFLINDLGEIEYHGAIDDWYYQLGKSRNEPTQHYLRNAINNYLLKTPIMPKFTQAIGCDIE